MRFAERVSQLPPYLFAELERKIAEKREAGVDVISLGIGDPDLPTFPAVVEEAQRQVALPDTHRYPSNRGRRAFREAVAAFYDRRFGVALDPETEVLPLLGGKEGVAHVCWSMLDPGDVCLAADPGYPVYTSGPLLAGAEPVLMPLTAEHAFQPDLDGIADGVRSRANLLFCNYPNNPTGAVIEDDFFERLARFGLDNDIPIVHDNAYSEITFDGYEAGSFLEAPGAKEAGIEMFSLSKSWNMTGWRVGAAVGNAGMIEQLWKLKTNIDSGLFDAVQMASIRALADGRGFVAEMCDTYRRRRDLLVEALAAVGIDVPPPRGTIYVWVPVPAGHTSVSFTELVLEQAGVVVSPGSSYGPNGEGYVRMSLTLPDDRLREAVARIEQHLRVG
ncbi:MAG TPA: LL-diaminopimelate aminotransferase [Gaiellales bacterium]|jgi:LL-diaminopimelate aminotransferase|nr:LL-diaminopimelate aminotransferase [Gaiellales bacterium]